MVYLMNKLVTGSAIVAMAFTLASCAERPENIAAIAMDDAAYANLSCKKLAREETKIRNDLDTLSATQNKTATKDAWGVFLLGLPLSSMSGSDKEALIGVAKGKLYAIDLVQLEKDCE